MFWGIEHEAVATNGLPRVRITIGSDLRTFSLSLPWADLKTRDGKELVAAWATTLIALPSSGIEAHEIESLLDFIEQQYPQPTRPVRDGRKRVWFFGF